jgi:serine/threonine protein kinase
MRTVVVEKQSWEWPEGHEFAPGRTVLGLLGGGRRYEVYRVWDERRSAVTVAKVLRPDLVREEHALRGLRREWRALEELSHPALVRGLDARLGGERPHLMVEHLEGPTLRRLVKSGGPLPFDRAAALGARVASLIDHMAQEGWLHLDLKPGNVVMGGAPRVIDLSLARTLERAKRLSEHVGTNAWMPPEQCHPRGDVGPASDVWGLGATLYWAIAGRPPFRRRRTRDPDAPLEDRFPQLEDEPLPWPRPVPAELSKAVLACLEKDPAARPAAAELAAMLEAARAPLPLSWPCRARRSPSRSGSCRRGR